MLTQAHLQRPYRYISLGFLLLVGLTLGGVAYAGWSQTTIDVVPVSSAVEASFTVTVSPDGSGPNDLAGTVTIKEQTATVTIDPDDQGQTVAAHARGAVTLINQTSGSQALAIGTRLQATNGVIVRTTSRIDIPARGQVTVEAIADPLGVEGEIPAGRLTIVALRSANQEVIFGQTDQPFTGGLVPVDGSLSVEALTKASNQAQQQIVAEFGPSQPGHFRVVSPVSVAADPKPEVPSTSYAVTVVAKTIEVTYDQADLDALIIDRLNEHVADDQVLISQDAPTITDDEQPSLDSIVLTVKARGQAELAPDSPLLQPSQFVNLNQEAITSKLMGSKLVQRAMVKIAPWWRQNSPSQPSRIQVRLLPSTPSE